MSTSSRTRAVLTAAAGAATLAVTATPAAATPPAPVTPTSVAVSDGGTARAADGTTGAAGYLVAVPDAAQHHAVATMRVGGVVCGARVTDPLILSTSLFGQVSASDTTPAHATAAVTVTCTGGVASYSLSVDTGSEQRSEAISPGDALLVQAATGPGSTTTLYVTNRSTGRYLTAASSGFLATGYQVSAQGGYGTGRFPRPVGPIRFNTTALDYSPLTRFSPQRFEQTNAAGDTVLATSSLNDNTGFSVTFVRQP